MNRGRAGRILSTHPPRVNFQSTKKRIHSSPTALVLSRSLPGQLLMNLSVLLESRNTFSLHNHAASARIHDWGIRITGIEIAGGQPTRESPECMRCVQSRPLGVWSNAPDASARYVFAVTIDVFGQEIEIYEPLRVAVDELEAELGITVRSEVELEVEES